MPTFRLDKQTTFIAPASIQTLFAGLVLYNEWMSISNRVPGGNYPIEHQASWDRVYLYCCAAVFCLLVSWLFYSQKRWRNVLPSVPTLLATLLPAALLLVGVGALLSHYLSYSGWCCEVSHAYYFGFPFSFLRGSTWTLDRSVLQFAGYSIFDVLRQPGLASSWDFHSYKFFLDLLFWFNLAFIFRFLVSGLLQPAKTRQPVIEQKA